MRLKDFIRPGATPPSATATFAAVAAGGAPGGHRVAAVAKVAVAGGPEDWADCIRTGDLPGLSLDRWALVSDALSHLIVTGAAAKALEQGWEAFDLLGVQRLPPHDAPHVAGLVFSMRPDDVVTDVRRAGCIIASGNVRHIWKRRPLLAGGSICLPWELPA